MITPEEKQEIIGLAVEQAMLILPETVGNLITNHMAMSKLNSEFYAAHPEFRDKKDVVAAVMEMVEGEYPLDDYENLLKMAIPKIRERISVMGTVNMTDVNSNPDRDGSKLVNINGEI